MKVSRKKHTTRAADGGLEKAAWEMLMRFSRSSGKKSARLIKWRGGVERFEANTHDQKERQEWPFDEYEDDWAKYVEGYKHEREEAKRLEKERPDAIRKRILEERTRQRGNV